MLIFQPPVNFCSDENIQTIFGIKLKDFLNYRIDYNSISQTVEKVVKIVIFILSARRECFLYMKRSFTPRRRSRQYKPLNAQKHLRARNINNIFSIIDSKN
jgi:GTP-sensing pleiotropic transcriptional regulator CodY